MPRIGQSRLRQGVERGNRRSAAPFEIELCAGHAVGRVAIVIGGNKATGSEVQGKAAQLPIQPAAGASHILEGRGHVRLHQLRRIHVVAGNRAAGIREIHAAVLQLAEEPDRTGIVGQVDKRPDRKSTRLNSSH